MISTRAGSHLGIYQDNGTSPLQTTFHKYCSFSNNQVPPTQTSTYTMLHKDGATHLSYCHSDLFLKTKQNQTLLFQPKSSEPRNFPMIYIMIVWVESF